MNATTFALILPTATINTGVFESSFINHHHGSIKIEAFLESWLSSFDTKKKNSTSLTAERYGQLLD